MATLYIGTIIAGFVRLVQITLVENVDDPLAERSGLAHVALKSSNIILSWSLNIPVSRNSWLRVFRAQRSI